jgi:ADP-heptose:LPS heptosyltransferase
MTAALKILRQQHDKIDLITDEKVLNDHPAVKAMAEEFFDDIKIKEPFESEYKKVYTAAWSRPSWMPKLALDWRIGTSEVQVYLDMIQKTKIAFEGFLTKTADKPKLEGTKPRIALANSSLSKGSRKGHITRWNKFPQLSKTLIDLGFDVILVGQGDELKNCRGQKFVDKLDIFETSFVISQCDLMVCVDTGLMHLADSLKVPIVLLAGSTFVTKAGPVLSKHKIIRKFISCAPCYQTGLWNLCDSPKCMQMIEVEDVLRKVFSFNLRDAYYEEPKVVVKKSAINNGSLKIAIPYYTGCDRVERAKKTWLYPEVVFATLEPDVKIREEFFYESASSEDLGFETRKKPLLKPIMQKLLDKYPDNAYYGFFNSDVILPAGKNVKQLLPDGGKVAAIHHRLDIYPNGKRRRYIGKDGFIMSKEVLQDFLAEFPQVILGAGGWDGGLFYWLWGRYGEENIDLRFDEILHYDHERGWVSADKDTYYNRLQVQPFRFHVDWDVIGDKYADLVRSQSVRKMIGIVQPKRLGDLLIILPIARWLFDRGSEILWPICSEWMYLQSYVNYVKFVDIGKLDGSYERALEYLTPKVDKVLDLGMGIGRRVDEIMPFDAWKYKEADVPFSERQNLQINRDYEKEELLKKTLQLMKPYTVTHSVGCCKDYNFRISNGVEVRPIGDFSLIDWAGVLEDAEKLYCVDSSITNLAEGLGFVKGKRFIKFNDNLKEGINLVRLSYDWQNIEKMPVHFFTLVWNGMPFIKHHLSVFEKLPFNWHWHIIEGPAQHGQDKGSCGHRSRGGFVPEDVADDGTLSYLEELSEHPQVTIYPRRDWKGKVDMADIPLKNINEVCILWQVDSDELYSVELLEKAYRIFMLRPDKNVGVLSYFQFVGPNKYVIRPTQYKNSIDAWGTHSYSRLWRFMPGLKWVSHAPPAMSLEKTKAFEIDVSFYHYSYVYEKQLKFKSSYYGYKDFISRWKALQEIVGQVRLGDFFPWLEGSQVTVDDWKGKHLFKV